MSEKIITATLHNMTPIPAGSIYRGNKMFEFETKKDPDTIDKKYAEYDPATNTYYKDKSIKALKLKADDVVKEREKIAPVIKKDKL